MREMKDSGIEWCQKIPANWRTLRIKYIMFERREKTKTGSEEPLSVTQKYGIVKSKDIEVSNPSISYNDYIIVSKDDIVFNKYKAHSGVFFVTPYDGIVTFNYSVYRCYKGYNPKYYEYLFHTHGCIGEFKMRLHGVGESISPLYTKDLFSVTVFAPPIEEQNRIVDYIDKFSFEINTTVSDIELEIETLEEYKRSVITEVVTKGLDPDVEMRDSEVQWIGMMPTHWDCQRGKYILRYVQKPVRDDDGVITCFRDGEVTLRSNRREEGFTMADKEIGYQGIDFGDLVVHGMDGFAGSIGISDSRGKASPVLNVLDTEQNKRYIMYYLRSMAYNDVFVALATGIRVRSCDLRWNKLAELLYPMPPIEEQQAIVEHIDSVLERTNAIISEKKQQIETIEEYKKSLIFEYVTGKKEVQA